MQTKDEKFQAYITKYALTKGILLVNATSSFVSNNMICYKVDNWDVYVHKPDWCIDSASALEQAHKMRLKKIASLKKQINRLETMTFYMPEVSN